MLQGREWEVPSSSKSLRSSNKIQCFSQFIARTATPWGLKTPEQRNLSQVLEEKCLCSEKPPLGGQGAPGSWICPSHPKYLGQVTSLHMRPADTGLSQLCTPDCASLHSLSPKNIFSWLIPHLSPHLHCIKQQPWAHDCALLWWKSKAIPKPCCQLRASPNEESQVLWD